MLEQLLVMGDDQDSHLVAARAAAAADPGDALARKANSVGVEAAVGFVEDREPRLEHGELEDLGPLHFSAGEAVVDVATGEVRIHRQLGHLGLEFRPKLLHRNQFFPLLAVGVADVGDRVPDELRQPDTGNRHRPLKGEENPVAGPLVGLHREHVVPRAVGLDDLD